MVIILFFMVYQEENLQLELRNKRKMNVEIIGEGEPLVFVHGFLWDSSVWDKITEIFSENYKCIKIDLWGHGKSDNLGEINYYSLEYLTWDIIEVVNLLDIDKFTYIGTSIGGIIGCHLGIKYGHKLNKLIILDCYCGEEETCTQDFYEGHLKVIAFQNKISLGIANQIAPLFFSIEESINQGELFSDFVDSLTEISSENLRTLQGIGRGLFGRSSILENLKEIDVPTLFLVGEVDIVRPFYKMNEMAKRVKNSEIVVVPKAGHTAILENPIFIREEIKKFLNKKE